MTDTPSDRQPLARPPSEGPWDALRQRTAARIGLARAGASLATAPLLDFRLAHGRARDAVYEPLDAARLALSLASLSDPVIAVASAAVTRSDYLLRPDLGRALAADAAADLAPHAGRYDVAFVVADGLSARAVQTHAPPVLAGVIEKLRASSPRSSSSTLIWRIAPLVIVRHGRVAISDAIANALGADCVAVLIGERPGLSAADSMSAYLTFKPQPGTTDADRNCISNIRPEGLGYADAAFKIAAMLSAMRTARLSGVRLKDDTARLLDGQG
jgi:ethanolamine ammonia-lyase small subunit